MVTLDNNMWEFSAINQRGKRADQDLSLLYREIKGILGLREKGVATQARSPPMVALHKNM
jgi:hypothetical protein